MKAGGPSDEDGLSIVCIDVPLGKRCVVGGELTMATRDELAGRLIELIDAGHGIVEIDLDAIEFMDSQGLWALMHARQHEGGERALRIVAAAPPVQRLLEVTTLDALFGYPPDP